MGVGIVVGAAVGDGVAATKVGVGVTTGVGVMGVPEVTVGPPHASPVIARAVIKEIKMRLFMCFAGVLISLSG